MIFITFGWRFPRVDRIFFLAQFSGKGQRYSCQRSNKLCLFVCVQKDIDGVSKSNFYIKGKPEKLLSKFFFGLDS